ncbi:CRO1 protein [Saccharata proteae CBS 121410]|uniref:CRO1 protein n=1 Tax=Saccharata proteae CBS 121410 TaxID=1314787 RepID=A0A9P4LWZ3_9PEZI|nr:CRO1 protein [Saccharata proteae CBS 121410]
MASLTDEEKVEQLTTQASAFIQSANFAHAAERLREASAIAPENPHVRQLWQSLQEEEGKDPLIKLCQSYVSTKNENDGKEAVRFVKTYRISRDVAEEAMKCLLYFTEEDELADQITGALLTTQLGARVYLSSQLRDHPHVTFERLFDRGDDSVDGLLAALLDPEAWQSKEQRIQAVRDIFMLSLAQMMEAGLGYPERAMKVISRALAAEAEHLKGIMDADSFDVILSSLDIRCPVTLRSQATLATAKLLELSPENSSKLITRFVIGKVSAPTTDGLITAFSAAAAIFPIATAEAGQLFLTEGFVEGFGPMVRSRGSARLEQAALELLSAACVDKNCRDAISKHLRDWLEYLTRSQTDRARANKAALILVKLHETSGFDESAMASETDESGPEDLVSKFKKVVLDSDETIKQESVEGLAYSSLRPKIKEELANDKNFLARLVAVMSGPEATKPLKFGGLTIFSNLTTYRPVRSAEQKRMAELKAYANTKKPAPPDPLDEDTYVNARCTKVLEAGVVPLLVMECKKASPSVLSQILQILLSLSKEQKHRGPMAQQGAVKLLIQIAETINTQNQSSYGKASLRTAAHALARILISVNPTHVFSASSALPITSAIRALSSLLEDDPSQEQRDLLPTFEGLLALTNLASTDDDARDAIIRLTWTRLEDLLLANNPMVQRASVELICNLMASPQGVAKFADGSAQASSRLHILLALADAEDLATRRGAGGALAMLTEWDVAADAVIKRDRSAEILLGLCADENEELRHRGVVCVKNIVTAPNDVGTRGKDLIKEHNGLDVLRGLLMASRSQEILGEGVAALKALMS